MTFAFGDYVLDAGRRELRRSGEPVALEPQVFDILVYLLRNRDRVVSKDDLIEAVWSGRIVSDSAVTTRLNGARKAVGDNGAAQRVIRTIPRKGVRFIAAVREEAPFAATAQHAPAAPDASSLALPDKPSIAVLPFTNLSGDSAEEFFADGIAEDIITLLSKSRALFVIARNSTFTYKGRAADVKQVGRELGVRYVLEGSVRKSANRVRVTGQLIDAATGGHLWAERYDRDLTDFFAMQDEITASVSAAILPAMEQTERERAARKPPGNLDAWECYHRGMWHFAKVEDEENQRALGFFEHAITLDPTFAAPHTGIALCLFTHATTFRRLRQRAEFLPRAIEHAQLAIALDRAGGTGHAALAHLLVVSGRHREAFTEADLAVTLEPSSAWAHGAQGAARAFGGQPREAIEPLKIAMRLSPFDPLMVRWLNHMARAHYFADDYEAAIATSIQLCQSYPNMHAGYRTLIVALAQAGKREEAQRVMSDAMSRFGEDFLDPMVRQAPELRSREYGRMLDGYRKAGVLDPAKP